MKKLWIIVVTLIFILCGCGSGEPSEETTAPTETVAKETELPSETQAENPEREMSQEELAQFQVLFDDPMGWYARALTSVYDAEAMVDLEKMFYCGAGETRVSDEEREYLKEHWDPILFEFDIVRCDEAAMEEALQLVFGRGLKDLAGIGLGGMTYYNGAYFRSCSDVLITIVRLDGGIWLSDEVAELYYVSDVVGGEECCIRMELLDGRWVIRSNQQVD